MEFNRPTDLRNDQKSTAMPNAIEFNDSDESVRGVR